jgi:signal transduction histidine kinase/ActR/RegA family two-component response regulator
MAGKLLRVRDTGLLSQLIVNESCRMFHTPAAILQRLGPLPKSVRRVAVSEEAASEADAHLSLAEGMEIVGLEMGEPTPFTTADLVADPRIPSEPGMRLLVERALFRAVLWVPLVLDHVVVGRLGLLDRPGRIFTKQEGRFALRVAQQAALALENAGLHEEAGRLGAATEAARAEAVTATRLKDVFLATLSHELRNPLTAILGWARMLQVEPRDKLKTERGLQAIERNARLQSQLVDDLLDVSRIIAGKTELDLRVLDLPPLIEEAVESLRRLAEEKGVHLALDVEPAPIAVRGDRLRLYQVVVNLVSNAIKFTPGRGRVHVRLRRHGASARITVSDTGRGIPTDLLPVIFEAFRQGKSPAMSGQSGLGLGLSIVRHLVELHAGTVEAASEGEGTGARFTVELPMTASTEPLDRRELRPASAAPMRTLDRMRVLVVDAHDDSREVLALMLNIYGAEVVTAMSAPEACELVRQAPVDILVSDLGLPGQDGYALIRQLREMERVSGRTQMPAIALTGHASSDAHAGALAAGYHAHVIKPIAPERLAAVIAEVVGRTCA